MDAQTLLHTFSIDGTQAPTEAPVILTLTLTTTQLRARARQFVSLLQEHDICPHDNQGSLKPGDGQTTISLPDNARAMLYHASGALRYVSGLRPTDLPFTQAPDKESLQRQLEDRASKLPLAAWTGPNSQLRFENLFLSRGQGTDPTGRQSAVTLFRAIGAWRQVVAGLPVLGAASVALRLAGGGRIDSLALNIRPGTGETLEQAALVEPLVGARQLVQQLAGLLGVREVPEDIVQSATLQLGYLDLGKRKAQRVLAPAYIARIILNQKDVRTAYVLAVAATEKPYLELPLFGSTAVAQPGRADGLCKANVG